MPFTVQKLQARIADIGRTVEAAPVPVSPVYVVSATGPMTLPPAAEDAAWQLLEKGQTYGVEHGTVWLRAELCIPPVMQRQPVALHLAWDTTEQDWGLLVLEATAFLDGVAIGGFDYRHQVLLLPEQASDGHYHTLTIQTYTRVPIPFGGLTMWQRNQQVWQLYHLMYTTLGVLLTLDKNDLAQKVLLGHLNAAYNLLDVREGWHNERFLASVQTALAYLQEHLTEGLNAGNRPHVTVSGHAHLDVGWLWPFWRTRQKIAHTVSNVLGLMDRYPYYYYSQSQPQLLQWLKEDLPDVFARVKERVAEGRFEPVGAMWVECDCNLTSGESLVRQILFGTAFTRKEFGITPNLIWLPDVFGYSAALPQIMRGCNIGVFMTTKISWNQFNRMPCDTFRWRGIDGSEVLTHFITAPDLHPETTYYTYNGPLQPSSVMGTWTNYRQQALNDELLYLCGWGDGGGGPAEDQLERARVMADMPDFPTVNMGRVTEYFDELYEHVWDNPRLPSWVGELYLEYHRGTYTSQAHVKQSNRRSELLYRDAELLNSWATLYGMPSQQEQLNNGWRDILLNQFHDVLPGSSIAEVYHDVKNIYATVRTTGERLRDEAIAALREQWTVTGDAPLLLNTLPWERTDPLQLSIATNDHQEIEGAQETTDWDGEPLVLLDGEHVPSCGMSVLCHDKEPARMGANSSCRAVKTASGILLSNDFYELALNTQGEIDRLFDKRANREVLSAGQTGNQLVAFEDRPMNYDAWDIDLYYEEKPYPLHEVSTMRIIEDGPVRATVEVVRQFLSSRITQRISLWRNSPRIDFATEIDWHEHQMLLKAAFPVAVNTARATYEIQFGSVERPTHRNTSWDLARFEVCAHRWADLSEGGYGVSLLNDSKYGHDIHDQVMRLTLLKSGVYPDRDADQGLHRFTYSLLPHLGDWRDAQTVRRAYELNVPIMAIRGQGEPGGQSDGERATTRSRNPVSQSFLSTDCEHVVVETVKPAEDGDGLIVRLYEAHNQRGQGMLFFATNILAVSECNLLEEPLGEATYQGNSLMFHVRPFEIKTFRVHLARA